jgi:hypothetical protein
VFVPWELDCTATRTGFNTNLDRDDPFPNNEPDSSDGVTFRVRR